MIDGPAAIGLACVFAGGLCRSRQEQLDSRKCLNFCLSGVRSHRKPTCSLRLPAITMVLFHLRPAVTEHEVVACAGVKAAEIYRASANMILVLGFREHIHQRCCLADAQRLEQARRWRHRPRGEEGERPPSFPTQRAFCANNSRSLDLQTGSLFASHRCLAVGERGFTSRHHANPRSTLRLRWTTSSLCSADT